MSQNHTQTNKIQPLQQLENASSQQKGMLLAKLLEKAVQNRKHHQRTTSALMNNSSRSSVLRQQQRTNSSNNKQKQILNTVQSEPSRVTPPSSTKKNQSSQFSSQKHNLSQNSFNESINQSQISIEVDQLNQMIRFVYLQLYGEEKYINDKKKYQEIQQHPERFNLENSQFNKEGKLLQNIIFGIRQINQTSKQLMASNKKKNQEMERLKKEIQNLNNQIKQIKLNPKKDQQVLKAQIKQKKAVNLNEKSQTIKQMQIKMKKSQNLIFDLRKQISVLQNENATLIQQTDTLLLDYDKKQQQVKNLQKNLLDKQKQVQNLMMTVGELQGQLMNLKEQIYALSNRQINVSRQIYEQKNKKEIAMTPPKLQSVQSFESYEQIRRLSTIRQKEDQDILTLYEQSRIHIQKESRQTQTSFIMEISSQKKEVEENLLQQESQTQTIMDQRINELRELQSLLRNMKQQMISKEKIIIKYQKQIESHQSEIEKYQNFIHQLSTEIEICQKKLCQQAEKRIAGTVNRKLQTDQKYFEFVAQENLQQLTFGQRQDGFLQHKIQNIRNKTKNEYKTKQQDYQRSIADNLENQANEIQSPEFRQRQVLPTRTTKTIVLNQAQSLNWETASVTISQISEQTQELKDIRKLTKQLSEAYDKIIALTYELNSFKKIHENPSGISGITRNTSGRSNQSVAMGFNLPPPGNTKMLKQK